MTRPVLTAESVTELGGAVRGAVLVAGSHAGIIAAYLGAAGGAHAMILNDAGVGRDRAGVAGLDYLSNIGMAAAAVSHMSARIGDGDDAMARGVISHCNGLAEGAGVRVGMSAQAAAHLLAAHAPVPGAPPPYADGRWRTGAVSGIEIWALDSVGKLEPEDGGRVLLIGSHGGLHGGRPASALNLALNLAAPGRQGVPVAARAAVFNDAGVGIEGIGITRLPELARRGMPAATVDCMSARIGDGRSMWETGIISHVNERAALLGALPGMSVARWVELVCKA